MNAIFEQDFKHIHESVDFSKLAGKKILVTGATGLVGYSIISAILDWNSKNENKVNVLAAVRSIEKGHRMYGEDAGITYVQGDVTTLEVEDTDIDYIIHGASMTSSKMFVEAPVDTVNIAIQGTTNMLEIGRKQDNLLGFVYMSSMEVYGSPSTDEKITEEHSTNIDATKVRSCYPESKRMCENLCVAYMSQYGVPVNVIRLTQTFGPGVDYNDGRVFAEFARCSLEKRNITLNTKGETKRNYLYTADAVTAILTILVDGVRGEAYNAANEDTYCSIYEMACLVADGKIDVVINDNQDTAKFGYAPVLRMNLDTSKLRSLGWSAKYSLKDMFDRMMETMSK